MTRSHQPLEPDVRRRMEARLGHGFSSVRVQESPTAARMHARAFAVGEQLWFAPGQYAPGTAPGAELLAHELGHVVEHRRGAAPGIYRAPEGQALPAGRERPYAPAPLLALGSLTLALGTLDGFAFNGSALTAEHEHAIGELAGRIMAMLAKEPGGRVTITGHTDLVGGEQSNLDLGRNRAVAVAAALAAAGVPLTSLQIASAGESAPVVQTEKPEPRNRRVEVRFAGAPIGSGDHGPHLRLGPPEPPPKYDYKPLFPPPIYLPPSPGDDRPGALQPPAKQQPAKQPPGQQPGPYDPGKPEPQPKAGSPGDIAKAVSKLPAVKQLLDDAQTKAEKDLGKLSTSDKVFLGTVSVPLVALVVAGIGSDPAARKAALDGIDGQEIPIPGLKGVSIVPHTKGGGVGAGVSFDIVKIFGGGK